MTLADVLAVGTRFTIRAADGTERELAVRELTLLEQAEVQRYLEKRAHDAVGRSEAPEEQKDRRHAAIDDKAALGRYEWDGDLGVAFRWTVPGMIKCLEISLRDQEVTRAEVEALVRDQLKRVAQELIAKAVKDPKAVAPLLAGLGLPTDLLGADSSGT